MTLEQIRYGVYRHLKITHRHPKGLKLHYSDVQDLKLYQDAVKATENGIEVMGLPVEIDNSLSRGYFIVC